MVMALDKNKEQIKDIYAAVIRQALVDWQHACKKDNRENASKKRRIKDFFKSDWGKQILDVLELDFKIINDKYSIFKN